MNHRFEPLSPDLVSHIVADACDALATLGVAVHDEEAAALLQDHGARVNGTGTRILVPPDAVTGALRSVPPVVRLFDTGGELTHDIGGDTQYFAPGSAATAVLDRASGEARPPVTRDYIDFVKTVDMLPNVSAQSTAFVPNDVPAAISDSYRLYLSVLHSRKPVITGAFSIGGFEVMRDLLETVRGTRAALLARPLAVFSCCPTSPLAWGRDAAATLIRCARHGIPVEIVPMPLAGFVAPVSLAGTLVQQTAEALAGIVIHQLANAGAPVLFGCASTIFDIRYETTPMACIESMLMACGSAQVGRHLDIPTQGYLALSDAKGLDAQAGAETAMGAMLAALSGINAVSGPGLLDRGSCFSLEKLVLDDSICGIASRARQGIGPPSSPPVPVIEELLREGHLLISADSRRHLRQEITFPSAVIDRASRGRWIGEGRPTLADHAAARISELRKRYDPPKLSGGVPEALTERMCAAARDHGEEALPIRCES